MLIFLSGEREIREASLAIKRAQLPHTEVVPLYARLSLAEQSKIFSPHRGRRVVLSTNVAETSLTVPGIGYVIDTGRARLSQLQLQNQGTAAANRGHLPGQRQPEGRALWPR